MSTVQIVLISIIGVCLLLSAVFMVMFIIEVCKGSKEQEVEEVKDVQSVFTINNYNVEVAPEKKEEKSEEGSVSEMLASLEEQTKDEPVQEQVEPEVEVVPEVEPVQEEVVEEPKEEIIVQDVKADDADSVSVIDSVGHGIIYNGNIIDYKARLEKVIETRNKIERDLAKRQKSILKYERTKRRMNRNQKMLDRRAGELTNLNLLMYSVTDIKNIDEEKKAKQEDLTAHIAELKASIQDADEYIASNKGKNENDIKMAKYLLNEKNRYNEEIAELEELIKSIESTTTEVV